VDTFEYVDLAVLMAILAGLGAYVWIHKRRAGRRAQAD